MLVKRCNDCNHRDICKHKDDYDNVIREINIKIPEPFQLELRCKHYYSTATYLTAGGNDYYNLCNTNVAKPYPPGGPEIVY